MYNPACEYISPGFCQNLKKTLDWILLNQEIIRINHGLKKNTSFCDVAILPSLWRKVFLWKSGWVKFLDNTTHKSALKDKKKNIYIRSYIQAKV